jgi:hypothetical protein
LFTFGILFILKDSFLLHKCEGWLWGVTLITYPMWLHGVHRANCTFLRYKR